MSTFLSTQVISLMLLIGVCFKKMEMWIVREYHLKSFVYVHLKKEKLNQESLH